jgi:hypothetical protein
MVYHKVLARRRMFTLLDPSDVFISGALRFTTFKVPGVESVHVQSTGNDTFFVRVNDALHEVAVVRSADSVSLQEIGVKCMKEEHASFFGKVVSHPREQYCIEECEDVIKLPSMNYPDLLYRDAEGRLSDISSAKFFGGSYVTYIASVPYTISVEERRYDDEDWSPSTHFKRSYSKNTLTNFLTGETTVINTDARYEAYFYEIGGRMYYTRELEDGQPILISCENGRILYNFQSSQSHFNGKDFTVFGGEDTLTVVTVA